MPDGFKAWAARVVAARELCSWKDRLRGGKRGWVSVKRLRLADGSVCKLVELRASGVQRGFGMHVRRAAEHLARCAGSDATPRVLYSDGTRIAVTWTDGEPLAAASLTRGDAEALGGFAGAGCRDWKTRPREDVLAALEAQAAAMRGRGQLPDAVYQALRRYLAEPFGLGDGVAEGICYGDTALKNFIKDRAGNLHYVDVLGLYRAASGKIAARHLAALPQAWRRPFLERYTASVPFPPAQVGLPFCWLGWLVDRVEAKSRKAGLLAGMAGRRKARAALKALGAFLACSSEAEFLGRCLEGTALDP